MVLGNGNLLPVEEILVEGGQPVPRPVPDGIHLLEAVLIEASGQNIPLLGKGKHIHAAVVGGKELNRAGIQVHPVQVAVKLHHRGKIEVIPLHLKGGPASQAAVGADSAAHRVVILGQLGDFPGLQVAKVEEGVLVVAIPLAEGGGKDHFPVLPEVELSHPVDVLGDYLGLPALNGVEVEAVFQGHQAVVLLGGIGDVPAAGGGVGDRRVRHRGADAGQLVFGGIVEVELMAQLIGKVPPVAPIGQLVDDLPGFVFFLILCQQLVLFLAGFALQVGAAGIHGGADQVQVFPVGDFFQGAHLQADGKGLLGFSAIQGELIVGGQLLPLLDGLLAVLVPLGGKEDGPVIQPKDSLFLAQRGHFHKALLGAVGPDGGIVAVLLVGLGNHKGGVFAVGGILQL